MTLPAGTILGRYEIRSKIGAGGMGEVYLAEDTQLHRRVALKILPAELASNRDRMRRFEQEATAAAALNHPNIAHIYEINEEGGTNFIAMEFVDGRTLREKMHREQTELRKLLKYLQQVADGLAKAHDAGIVHRDLKPDNVMITREGYAKILDFGLAKLVQVKGHATSDEAMSEVATAMLQKHSLPGTVMGTAGYMSPEQAQGKVDEIDHRSDIFSFGCILFEAATGKKAFEGDSIIKSLHQVVYEAAPLIKDLNPSAPADLQRIIRRCLAKDPEQRFQTIKDVAIELRELRHEMEGEAGFDTTVPPPSASKEVFNTQSGQTLNSTVSGAPSLPTGTIAPATSSAEYIFSELKRHKKVAIAALAVAALVVIGGVWYLFPLLSSKTTDASNPIVNATFTKLTDQAGPETFPSLSPDGKSLVYVKQNSEGKFQLYLQRVEGKSPINLSGISGYEGTGPAYSPDGESIAFNSDRDGGGIFVMGATGESVKRLAESCYNAAWSPDGKEIVCATEGITDPSGRSSVSKLWAVNAITGEKRLVTNGDAVQPSWSPHGQRIAYWGLPAAGGQRDLWTVAASGGEPVRVTDDKPVDWNPVWSPDGKYLYFASDRGGSMNLWRVPIDEQSGKVLGAPQPVPTPASYAGHISFSRDGQRMAFMQLVRDSNIQQIGFDPAQGKVVGQPVPVTQGSNNFSDVNLSPDGEALVFSSGRGGKQEDIFIVKTDGTGQRQLTNDTFKDRRPRWWPDGKKIIFYSDRSGKYEVWTINPDGSGLQQLTFNSADNVNFPITSPDGTRVVYTPLGGPAHIIEVGKLWNQQTPQTLPPMSDQNTFFWATSWSADGKKLAGWTQGGSVFREVTIYSFDSNQYEKADSPGLPEWLHDNRRVLVTTLQSHLYLLDTQSGKMQPILSVAPRVIRSMSISKDDRLIYFDIETTEADIWLVTFGAEARP